MVLPIIKGTTDEVTACDCCGKSPLKMTVIVEIDEEIRYYGSTCATRHTGKKTKEINAEIRALHAKALASARIEVAESSEKKAFDLRFKEREIAKIPIGKESADFVRDVNRALDRKKQEIAKKYNLSSWF